jgi:hypothetical protein
MNSDITARIIGLNNRIFIFSIDLLSFIRNFKDDYIKDTLKRIAGLTQSFSDSISETDSKQEKKEIVADIEKTSTFAAEIIELLKTIQCSKELINEKNDLVFRMYQLLDEISDTYRFIKNTK